MLTLTAESQFSRDLFQIMMERQSLHMEFGNQDIELRSNWLAKITKYTGG